jgi:hypothetical protein
MEAVVKRSNVPKSGTTRPETARNAGAPDSESVKSRVRADKRNGRTDIDGGEKAPLGDPEAALAQSDSRARGVLNSEQRLEAARCVTSAAKAQLIHDWMLTGVYVKGKTDRALAEVWGCARSTVWNHSAFAWRLLNQQLQGATKEELTAALQARIAAVGQSALERTEEVVTVQGDVVEVRRPDHRTALRALEVEADLFGLRVHRHHHTVTAEQLTTEQIHEQLRQHGYQLTPPTVEASGEEVTDRTGAGQQGESSE